MRKIDKENSIKLFVDPIFVKDFKVLNKKKLLPTVSRNSMILMKFVGLKVNVYTGRKFTEILVSKEMVGHKFGEFSSTREKFTFKKKKKEKKIKWDEKQMLKLFFK